MTDTISAEEYNELTRKRKRSKYGNHRVEVDGRTYDSKAEARRSVELLWLAQAGKITDLEYQPRFPITVNGRLICEYRADFQYRDEQGRLVVEDVKSPASKTPVYRLKKKLVRAVYEIEIQEVE